MLNRLSHTQLLRYAGLFTWAVVGIPLIVFTWHFPADASDSAQGLATPGLTLASLAYLAFGVIYWQVTRALGARRPRLVDALLLAALTLSAIVVSHQTGTGMGAVLMMIIAGVIPWLVPLPVGVLWLVLQHVALVPVFSRMEDFTPGFAVLQAMLYVGYSSFAMVIGLVAKQQAEALGIEHFPLLFVDFGQPLAVDQPVGLGVASDDRRGQDGVVEQGHSSRFLGWPVFA